MTAVGIDVSKGKSMMIALQPMNKVVLKPREYPHTEVGLEQMALAILNLGEDTRAIMEATAGITSRWRQLCTSMGSMSR